MKCPVCQHDLAENMAFCPACGTQLEAGTTVEPLAVLQERFELIRKLGQGGMGAVYLARDRRLSTRQWAVKEMSDAAITGPLERQQAAEAFKHEAELLAGLSHPNLPQVADYFVENGKSYLVMEFVPGESLLAYIQREGLPRPLAEVLDWARQIFDVLDYLHTRQPPIIFRDLKPSNIMITPQRQIKLVDFGIARVFKPGKDKDTQAFGTMGYSAPEQYGKGQTDARSDIYSLGVLLHQLLTGYDPASSPFRLPPASQVNPNVPADLNQCISQATAAVPAERFPSIAAFRAAFEGSGQLPVAPSTRLVTPALDLAPPTPAARPAEAAAFRPGPQPGSGDAVGKPVAEAAVPRSSGLAQTALWMGGIGLAVVTFCVALAIWANVIDSEDLSLVATLLGTPGLITGVSAPIIGFVALARNETARSLRGRRDAIIGTVLGLFTLPLCCVILVILGSLSD